MSTLEMGSVPRLRRGVRLSYDQTRETHVLLFPEGVLVPNPTAAAVLKLCDGVEDVAAIASALRERYSGVREEEILDVLSRLGERRIVEWT
ncbi:pyrroloquinoline quinone biosynthesis peptide chaperone PqqD [Amycolatopsis sp. WAC 01375]|uniref:pyrroloquinoline quinone biosynthesis peptide chaperone PqqD n=1 Tax=unclassified Amycolatopsis TaxID=2618356 RepID=UPI000F774B6E|nr:MULTISPECIES: pyrroloquinoline quinone biosynthesis peptide chaperone PqqD [unclassified Amycolatopsis]RSM72013.1 pyrroloquinoline quinone biosynthesis peptide chaperone PqqD [Amycolatopsis sp. WAC 01375]RSN32106.1 pyrroloquinoline quinone biosynthesis peptide chaperone PqqD [Amycolatopsis sp. WAC 01416]